MKSYMIDGVRVVIPDGISMETSGIIRYLSNHPRLAALRPHGAIVRETLDNIYLDAPKWARNKHGWAIVKSLVRSTRRR